jgi:hypothetical protein
VTVLQPPAREAGRQRRGIPETKRPHRGCERGFPGGFQETGGRSQDRIPPAVRSGQARHLPVRRGGRG